MFSLKWLRRSGPTSPTGQTALEHVRPPVGFTHLFAPVSPAAELRKGYVVVIGNCYSESIERALAHSDAKKRFTFFAAPIHLKPLYDPAVSQALESATHVIAQEVGGINRATLRQRTSDQATIWTFPDVAFRSAWPFDSAHGWRDEIAERHSQTDIRHFDGGLSKLREIEPDKKKRIQRYAELDFDLAKGIPRIFEAQSRFLEKCDEGSDVPLGHFIRDHAKEQLFYNCTHPSAAIFQYLCAEFWTRLGEARKPPAFVDLDCWRDWSVPVHPKIAALLGLRWADARTRYRYCTLGDLTWLEWVEAYVDAFG